MENKYGPNYIPGSISFAEGFLGPRGDVGYSMEYDEQKAIDILKEEIKKGHVFKAKVGLDGDWSENSAILYENDIFNKTDDLHKRSIWATPIMIVEYDNAPTKTIEVWKKLKD